MANRTPALYALAMAALFAAAIPARAEMSEADRLARCANNNARIAELQAELARESGYMSPEELARARTAISSASSIESLASGTQYLGTAQTLLAQMISLSRDFRVDTSQCAAPPNADVYQISDVIGRCSQHFENVMVKRIKTAYSLAPLHAAILARIGQHRVNLAALQCTGTNAGNTGDTSHPAGTQVSSKGCHGFDGRWDSGGFIVTIHGSSGTYTYNNVGSSLNGTINGNTMTGHWSQPGYPNPNFTNGEFTFMLSGDGNGWTGTYTDKDGNPGGNWNGTCVGP